MSSNASKGTVVRLVVLVVILLAAGGAFFYMQNRPPSLEKIQESISMGDLWGQPLSEAKTLFKQEPKSVELEPTDSPTTERWLFTVHTDPPTYYLIRVQNGTISHAQVADQVGKPIGG